MNPDSSARELPLEISVEAADQLLRQEPNILLIDCRTPEEHALARIDRARLMPIDEIQTRLAELQPYRDQPMIVHCHLGGRSELVTQWLRRQGFLKAQNLTGGIDAWSQVIDPGVPRY